MVCIAGMGKLLIIHGKGGHGRVLADACKEPYRQTDDAAGTRPEMGSRFICAIGDNEIRAIHGGNTNIIHSSAVISEHAELGMGIYVGAQVSIGPDAHIDDGAIINTGAVVEHDCAVGAYAHIAPGAVLCGGVVVGAKALVGAGAVVKPGLSIGHDAVVGCGAAVVCDIPPGETWVGVPARKRGI